MELLAWLAVAAGTSLGLLNPRIYRGERGVVDEMQNKARLNFSKAARLYLALSKNVNKW